jgi:hypothetical protein
MTVESLSKRTGDAGFRSLEECLQDCLNDIGKHGAFANGKKILVIALDDTTGGYGVSWAQAGMKMSECLSLCDVAKQLFLHEMEYNMMPGDVGL